MFCNVRTVINIIASIVIFIIFFVSFSFLFSLFFIITIVTLVLFFSFYFWLSNSFSHMKRLRLVDYFVSLFICFFCFLGWNSRVTIHSFITFLPISKSLQFSSFISILTWFYILFWILHCFLPLVLSWIYFNRSYGSY